MQMQFIKIKNIKKIGIKKVVNIECQPHNNFFSNYMLVHNCSFCDKSVFGSGYRAHSAQRVIDECVRAVQKYKARELSLVDDTFSILKNRVYEFCKLKNNHPLLKDVIFNARISVNSVDKNLLLEMRKSGCYYLEIGVESGDPRVLKDIQKGTTHEKMTEIINYAYDIGYQVKIFMMVAYPTDTFESMENSIKYIKSLKATSMVCTIFTPFKGTKSYDHAKEFGTIIKENDYNNYNNWGITFLPKGMTEDDVRNYWKKTNKAFYLRPIMIWRNLKFIRSFEDIKRYAGGVKVLLRLVFKK
jgi:radical SAM superfamily enzyme YgiQ (UPF0313 family)